MNRKRQTRKYKKKTRKYECQDICIEKQYSIKLREIVTIDAQDNIIQNATAPEILRHDKDVFEIILRTWI